MELTEELAEARKQGIEEIARYIFPIEVQELDEQDMDISKSGDHKLVIVIFCYLFQAYVCPQASVYL